MFAKRLKELRSEKGVVQKDVAIFLNITTSAYGFYEQGKRIPDTEIMIKLSDYFNVSLDYLLGKTDIKKPTDSLFNDSKETTIVPHSDVDYDVLPNEDKILQKLDQMQNKIDSIEAITNDTHSKDQQLEKDFFNALSKHISFENELNIFVPFISNLINNSDLFTVLTTLHGAKTSDPDEICEMLKGLTIGEFSKLYKVITLCIIDILKDREKNPIEDEKLFLKISEK